MTDDKYSLTNRRKAALLDGFKSASGLARQCYALAEQFPKHAAQERKEASRHHERAIFYLQRIRWIVQDQAKRRAAQ